MIRRRLGLALVLVILALVASACGVTGGSGMVVNAVLPSASNIFVGSEVRILGVQVGTVSDIQPSGQVVNVEMTVDPSYDLPADVGAELVAVTLLGERIMEFSPAYTGGPTLSSGDTIPVERTAVPAEVDDVIRSFENFLDALDEGALADLIDAATDTLAGQGPGLNDLIDQGAQTLRILDDAAGDLNGVVSEFADFNEALATRSGEIGETIRQFDETLRFLVEERDEIIGTVQALRRLAVELRPLLDEHTEPLIEDLETLATTLGTVDRNLDNIADFYDNTASLFGDFGPRVPDFETARLKLDNESNNLGDAITRRLTERLTGLCLRLGIDECASNAFWEPFMGTVFCAPGSPGCDGQPQLTAALASALSSLPEDAQQQMATELQSSAEGGTESPPGEPIAPQGPAAQEPQQQEQAPQAPAPDQGPADQGSAEETPPPSAQPLPLPDPRLSDDQPSSGGGARDGLTGGE